MKSLKPGRRPRFSSKLKSKNRHVVFLWSIKTCQSWIAVTLSLVAHPLRWPTGSHPLNFTLQLLELHQFHFSNFSVVLIVSKKKIVIQNSGHQKSVKFVYKVTTLTNNPEALRRVFTTWVTCCCSSNLRYVTGNTEVHAVLNPSTHRGSIWSKNQPTTHKRLAAGLPTAHPGPVCTAQRRLRY
jgi:hypothetical protein